MNEDDKVNQEGFAKEHVAKSYLNLSFLGGVCGIGVFSFSSS